MAFSRPDSRFFGRDNLGLDSDPGTAMFAKRPTYSWNRPTLTTPGTRRLAGPDWLPRVSSYEPVKEVLDLIFAAVLLLLLAPVILLAALLVKLTSKGPAFYTQTRLGRYGKLYTIYKLRTMQHNCEKLSGACWSQKGDPRVTPVGRFLRATHIDELPQLWNVLRGEMSLVGPRPERPEFLPQLEQALPHYRSRLLVRPGLTGLAQVQLPPDTDLYSVRKKLAHDLHYIQNCSLWMDVRLLIATVLYLFKSPVPVIRQVLALPGGWHVERAYEALAAEEVLFAPVPFDESIPEPHPSRRLEVAAAS